MEDIVDTSVVLTHAPLPPTSSAAQFRPPPSSPPPPHDMFAGTVYFLAPSLPVGRRAVVDALLREYGGEEVDVTDERLTTVIAPHGATRWEGWDVVAERESAGRRIDVVTDVWVDRSVLLGKVQSPQHYSIEPALIFSGIIACAVTSDFSISDLEVLAAGISALGGQWRTALTRDVTHLFALKTGTLKYETAVHFQKETGVTILVPHWFDDSVRLGGGLPTAEYEWPEPKVLHRGVSAADEKTDKAGERDPSNDTALSALTPPLPEEEQMRRNVFTSSAYTPTAQARSSVENGTLELGVAGINPYTRLSPGGTALELPSPRASPYPLSQPLKGKHILISRNLGLSGGRLGALHAQITRAGGTIVRFAGDDDEHESEEPAEDGGGGGWTVSATFRPGERGYKPLLAHPHPHLGAAQGQGQDKPITRILGRLPPAERARRRAELAAVGECDVMITRWRWGAAYVRAVREKKTVATLAWLFFLLMPVSAPGASQGGAGAGAAKSARPAPTEQLLHYPVPKGPVEGFEKHVVTVTNYTGEAREYLKKLITAMGGTFTPSMSGQNTVLIAAYVKGTKAEKARAWSIPVVNHTWLEDCFAQWRNLTVALEKYIVFPPGVDFSALLGSRGVFVGAGKHPIPGLGLGGASMTAAAAEQQEAELGRLEAEAEELLEEYDELADEWEDERRVERRRNAEGVEEWVAVAVTGAYAAAGEEQEQEEDSQMVPPSGTEAEIREVVDDLIEVRDDGDGDDDGDVDMADETGVQEGSSRGRRSPTPVPVKPKAKANGQAKHSPTKPGPSTNKNGKEKETTKSKTKKAVVEADVLDLSSSESEVEVEAAKPVKKGPPTSAKKSSPQKRPAKVVRSEDEYEEEAAPQGKRLEQADSDVEVVPAKKPSARKVSSSAKPVSKLKKSAHIPSEEEDEEEQAEEVADEDEHSMDDSPKAKSKKPASKADKGTTAPKVKPAVAEEEESTSEDSLVLKPSPNGQSKSTARPAAAGPSKASTTKPDQVPAFPSSSLMARPKVDARTRVVRRTPKDSAAEAVAEEPKPSKKKKIMVEESEDSDEFEVSKPNGKGKESAVAKKGATQKPAVKETKKPASKGKGRVRIIDTPESEDEEDEDSVPPPPVESEPEPEPEPAPRRKLIRRATAERPAATSKPVSKSAATSHSKKVHVEENEDSDDSLPEASHILSKLDKTAATDAVSKPKSRGKAKESTDKVKPSATTKASSRQVESESESEDEHSVVTVKRKSKSAAKPTTTSKNAVAGPSTPKRTVSVLMPSLNLSGKPKSAAAKEVSKPKSAAKAKKPVSEEPENESQEEDEVTNLVSPKLTRTGSLRVASGHVSTPSSSTVVKKTNKQEKSRSKRTADEALSSGEDETRRMPPPPQASTSNHAGPLPRRTAAAKASERLHTQIMPDVIAYESQKKRAAEQARKGRVSMDAFKVAGEGSLEELTVQPGSSQLQARNGKRGSQGGDDDDDDDEKETRPVKKKRRVSDEVEVVIKRKGKAKAQAPVEADEEALNNPSIHIMTTQVNLSDDVLRALLKIGIKMTSRANDCTHLIAKQVVRTEKFLCALTRAPWIVTEAWALNCVAQKKVLPENDYLLKDKAGEDKYGVRLTDALRRAEELKGSLFKGHTFYVTNRVPVDSRLLKNVVNACGGQLSTHPPTVRIINTSPDTRHVISCADDISIWRPLASANIKVYTQELLLNGALRQQVDYDSDEFLLKT